MDPLYSSLYKHVSYQVKISPNSRYLANAIDDRLVIRNHKQDLGVFYVYSSKQPIQYIEWAPNSEYILTANYDESRIEIWSVIDTNYRALIKDLRVPIVQVKWSSDSKNILYTTELKLILGIWNLSTKTMKYINHIKYSEKGIEISPDEKYIAIAEKKNGKDYMSIYHSHSFIVLQNFELGTADLQNFRWSPDSTYIAVWDNPLYHKLLVYRQDGVQIATYSGYEYGLGIKSIQWSPNSQILALGNYDQTIHLLSTKTWKLIGTLDHPTTLSTTADTNIVQEITLPKPQVRTLIHTSVDYQHITRRPYNISTLRPEYNHPNPKVGIGLLQFSADGTYICSRSDNMPEILWIWQIKTLSCFNMIIFQHPVKQATWNPQEAHMLLTICGDRNMHFIQPTDHDEIEIVPFTVPIADFNIRKVKWNSNGESLVLMDQNLYCLAVLQ